MAGLWITAALLLVGLLAAKLQADCAISLRWT